MKKLLILFMIAAVFVSCKKNETPTVQDQQKYAEVSFNVNKIIPEANRDDFPMCSDADPVTADIVIKNADLTQTVFTGTVDLFVMPDGIIYTQAIKLMLTCVPGAQCCNTFYVTEFYVKDAAGTIIYAAPAEGSDAQGWLDYQERMLNLELIICEFTKYEYNIDVLCYEDEYFESFGFVWFYVHEAELREICFFGDVCLKYPGDYYGSSYENQLGFPSIDVPAIAEIKVFKWVVDVAYPNGHWVEYGGSPYTNNNLDSGWGVGAPLCISYIDYLDKVDLYKAELWVMLKQGDGFPFIYMDEWIWHDVFEDEEGLVIGDDIIVDYVVGNCNVDGADYVYPPWMNLPEMVTMHLQDYEWDHQTPPEGYNGEPYWDAWFTDFDPSGSYDIEDHAVDGKTYDAWCGDLNRGVSNGNHLETYVFSTLEPASNIPSFIVHNMTDGKMKAMTYLANHWNTQGINNSLVSLNAEQGLTVQNAIWMVAMATGDDSNLTPYAVSLAPSDPSYAPALALANDALSPGNFNAYLVLPGGNTFILFFAKVLDDEEGWVYRAQLILITVDP